MLSQSPLVATCSGDTLTTILASVRWVDCSSLRLTSRHFYDIVESPGFRHTRAVTGFLETCVVVTGGYTLEENGTDIRDVWALMKDRTWLHCPPLPVPNAYSTSFPAAAVGGAVCIFSGEDVFTLDLQQRPPIWHRSYQLQTALMRGNPVIETIFVPTTLAQMIPLLGSEWDALPPMPISVNQSVIVVLGGKMLVAGGCYDGPELSNPALIAPPFQLPCDQNGTIIRLIDDPRNYHPGSDFATNALQVYDPLTNEWQLLAPMPECRADAAGCVFEDRLFVIGGSGDEKCDEVLVYCPDSESWSTSSATPIVAGEDWFTTDSAAVPFEDQGILVFGSGCCSTAALVRLFEPRTCRWIKVENPPRFPLTSDPEFPDEPDSQWWHSMVAVSGVLLG